MLVTVKNASPNGEALPGGDPVWGKNNLEIVQGMMLKSPFNNNLEPRAYMHGVFGRLGCLVPLPKSDRAAADVFIGELAARGLVEMKSD